MCLFLCQRVSVLLQVVVQRLERPPSFKQASRQWLYRRYCRWNVLFLWCWSIALGKSGVCSSFLELQLWLFFRGSHSQLCKGISWRKQWPDPDKRLVFQSVVVVSVLGGLAPAFLHPLPVPALPSGPGGPSTAVGSGLRVYSSLSLSFYQESHPQYLPLLNSYSLFKTLSLPGSASWPPPLSFHTLCDVCINTSKVGLKSCF